jgi:vacuolar protein sorting-associated protein 13A/C
MNKDGIVRPYSKQEAEGFKIFRDTDKGKFATSDEFAYSEPIVDKEVLLVTDHRILYVVKSDLFGGWQSEWIYKWEEIASMRVVDRGLEITLEAPKQKSSFSKMFSSSDKLKKVLLINNRKRCEKLLGVMNSLHQKRRT